MLAKLAAILLIASPTAAWAAQPANVLAPTCEAGTPFITTDATGDIHTGCRGTHPNAKPVSALDTLTAEAKALHAQLADMAAKLTAAQLDVATGKTDHDAVLVQHTTDAAAIGAAHDRHMNDMQALADWQRRAAACSPAPAK